ncbi:Hypothetical_protein [Hexamita inflata]|uniref:Hypothetical_protein n=1 Tax=Hexamita inflata TaxID=28002 RepID=A0AA86QZ47_9EUKA|nr:Hypothetical protein HINF_LOCUS50228 [Hexamita inflata]
MCNFDCNKGYCELTDNNYYECKNNTHFSYYWYLCIIPAVLLVLLFVLHCCNKKKLAQQQAHESKQGQPPMNTNLTGVQGQLITLPDGQVGMFRPLTQAQLSAVHQSQQVQISAPLFYHRNRLFNSRKLFFLKILQPFQHTQFNKIFSIHKCPSCLLFSELSCQYLV